jgi:acetyl esterase
MPQKKTGPHGTWAAILLACIAVLSLPTRTPVAKADEPSGSPATKSFVYKKTKQGELSIVVHFPPGWKETDKRPAIVFFFGGGWTSGALDQFEPQAKHLASRGMVAARADYRVKSRHDVTPKECVEDAKSAVRWMRQNAATLGADPNRIVAAGGSAGGHIAACTAFTPGLEGEGEDAKISSMPNALVLFNPVLRFSGFPELMARIGNDEALGKALSPTLHLKKDSPPTLLFFGTADRLAAMGDEFMRKSKELGHRGELFTAEGQPHGFFNRPPWLEKTIQRMDEFLESLGYLQPPAKDSKLPGAEKQAAAFAITTKKPDDRIETKVGADSVVFDIRSRSGIGGATIAPQNGKWPATVVLRLHLGGLESFDVSNGKIKLAGSVLSHSGNTKRLHLTEGGDGKEREAGTEIKVLDAAGNSVQGLPGKDGCFEIALPKALLESQPPSLDVGWIDFFR